MKKKLCIAFWGTFLLNQVEQIWFFWRWNLSLYVPHYISCILSLSQWFSDTAWPNITQSNMFKGKIHIFPMHLCVWPNIKGTYEFLARYIWPASHRLLTLPIQVWKNWNSIFVYYLRNKLKRGRGRGNLMSLIKAFAKILLQYKREQTRSCSKIILRVAACPYIIYIYPKSLKINCNIGS